MISCVVLAPNHCPVSQNLFRSNWQIVHSNTYIVGPKNTGKQEIDPLLLSACVCVSPRVYLLLLQILFGLTHHVQKCSVGKCLFFFV